MTFPADVFGMFVDVNPNELVSRRRPDVYQVICGVHAPGAPAEKIKWLKQYKDVGWNKKRETIRLIVKALRNGQFGRVAARIVVSSEDAAYTNGLAVLRDNNAAAALKEPNGTFSFNDESLTEAEAASLAWYGMGLGMLSISATSIAAKEGQYRVWLGLDRLPQRPKLFIDFIHFLNEHTYLKTLWQASGAGSGMAEIQIGNPIPESKQGMAAKASIAACLVDWIAASAAASFKKGWEEEGENRTEERRDALAEIVFELKDLGQLSIFPLMSKVKDWDAFASNRSNFE